MSKFVIIKSWKHPNSPAHLDLLTDELELAEGPLGIVLVLQVGEGDLVDAALEAVGGDPGASSPVHEGLANLAHLEQRGGLDVIPAQKGWG